MKLVKPYRSVGLRELEEFNKNIGGDIRIVEVFFGDGFKQPADGKLAEMLLKFRNNG